MTNDVKEDEARRAGGSVVEEERGPLRFVRLERPSKRNALTRAMLGRPGESR